jgi:hypothetical protein
MQTITLNPTTEYETQVQMHEASARTEVRVVTGNWGFGVQELRRSYGEPRELGAGARRAVHQFGDALKRLAQ